MNDWELLQDYSARGSETAFRTLTERHLNLVYAVAMRQVKDATLPEEVCQSVLLLLARKAGRLKPDTEGGRGGPHYLHLHCPTCSIVSTGSARGQTEEMPALTTASWAAAGPGTDRNPSVGLRARAGRRSGC